jgi:hypothetical protein
VTPRQFIHKWLADNVNPFRFHTGGVFDSNTPAIARKQLLDDARRAGFSEKDIVEAEPYLEIEAAQAIMRVVKFHEDEMKKQAENNADRT